MGRVRIRECITADGNPTPDNGQALEHALDLGITNVHVCVSSRYVGNLNEKFLLLE